MDLIYKGVILGVFILAGVLLFTPYEALFEEVIAVVMFAAVGAGFLLHPRRDIFYVSSVVQLRRPHNNRALEHDFLAVRVELARLWLLFVPTILAVTVLVFLATGGPNKFSFLNWIFSSRFVFIPLYFSFYAPLLVFALLHVWVHERRVLRDAATSIAKSLRFTEAASGRKVRVSYAFVGEDREIYVGDCYYWGLRCSPEVEAVVFYSGRKPDLNKIAMGFLFHRVVIIGRGVTDLDKETVASQQAWVHAEPVSQPE